MRFNISTFFLTKWLHGHARYAAGALFSLLFRVLSLRIVFGDASAPAEDPLLTQYLASGVVVTTPISKKKISPPTPGTPPRWWSSFPREILSPPHLFT